MNFINSISFSPIWKIVQKITSN